MINKVILVGDVWKNPLERTTTKGESMCVLYLVTKEYQVDKNTSQNDNKTYIEKKEWHNIVAFGTTAQYILKNITIGDIVYVEGQIQTREVTDMNNNKKYLKDIIVNRTGLVKKIYSKKRQEGSINLSDSDEEDVYVNNLDKNNIILDDDEDLLF